MPITGVSIAWGDSFMGILRFQNPRVTGMIKGHWIWSQRLAEGLWLVWTENWRSSSTCECHVNSLCLRNWDDAVLLSSEHPQPQQSDPGDRSWHRAQRVLRKGVPVWSQSLSVLVIQLFVTIRKLLAAGEIVVLLRKIQAEHRYCQFFIWCLKLWSRYRHLICDNLIVFLNL